MSETNTGTHPLLRNSDGDNAEDWYEVFAAYTDPTDPTEQTNIPYPLPDPDSSTGTGTKPVKVFILSGQSNMVGFGRVSGTETDTFQSLTRTDLKFPNLITTANAWTVRNDVMFRGVISDLSDAPLAPGFGADNDSFGPELGFGHLVGYHHDEPVLIIKTSIGNRALGWDFPPPGSGRYNYSGTTYAGYGDYGTFPIGGTAPVTGNWYAGKQYDDSFLASDAMGRGRLDLLYAGGDFATWASQWPGSNLNAPTGNFDDDELTNDDERVCGLNPTSSVSVSPIKSMTSLQAGTFTYVRRPPSLSDRTYTVWTSSNLTT